MPTTKKIYIYFFISKKSIIHPNRTSSKYHDIALLELEKPVTFDKGISPICLYNELDDLPESVDLYAEGWGVIDVDSMYGNL